MIVEQLSQYPQVLPNVEFVIPTAPMLGCQLCIEIKPYINMFSGDIELWL